METIEGKDADIKSDNNVVKEMEKTNTASQLLDYVEKFCFSRNDGKITLDEDQVVAFWVLLGKRLSSSDRISLIARLLNLGVTKSPPPVNILQQLFELSSYDPRQLQALSLQYPMILHIKSSTFEELPLHMVSKRGCKFKKEFESLLLNGIRHHVGGVDGFGGFITENRTGQTPLSLLFANVASSERENWKWLCRIIKLAVEQNFNFSAKNGADFLKSQLKSNYEEDTGPPLKHDAEYLKYFRMLKMGLPIDAVKHALKRDGKDSSVVDLDPDRSFKSQLKCNDDEEEETGPFWKEDPDYEEYSPVPSINLLHAALELGGSLGLINRILLECDDLTECDSLGRTPLLIAMTNKNTSYNVIETLIQKCRTSVKIKDNSGNLPLHLKIKTGRNTIKNRTNWERDSNDFNVIGAIVQESPESLEVQDDETKLPPFMLASVDDNWSLDVVYGLLRTSPWVITSYSCES